jgi:hypothetical protein
VKVRFNQQSLGPSGVGIEVGAVVFALNGQRNYVKGTVVSVNGDQVRLKAEQFYNPDLVPIGGDLREVSALKQYCRVVK